MPSIQHVYRRGSVYWWRRRFPAQLVTHACGRRSLRHFQASLGVREIEVARSLAAHLTGWSEVVFSQVKTGMLSASEINSVLQGELKRLRIKFAALSALEENTSCGICGNFVESAVINQEVEIHR